MDITTNAEPQTDPQTEAELKRQEAQRHADYVAAAKELGLSIGLGLLPFLGQAIDIYDTLESIWRLNSSHKPDEKEAAQFDLILALIGWIPGPGDGVKKSLRLVNKNPQRFAPILFDLLREVLEICKVKTSPEALLDEIFNASKLKAQMIEIRKSIEQSSLFKELSQEQQDKAHRYLQLAEANLPPWVGIVQKRLAHWKKLQPNSSARPTLREKKTVEKPAAKDAQIAQNGKGHPVQGQTNSAIHAQLATEPLPMGNNLYGISGEHIADYYSYTHYGWGTGWEAHDKGNSGAWKATPSKTTPGKLSNKTMLYHLTTKANDQGIDATWRVPTGNAHNKGKPYAIVEAKADANLATPNFFKSGNPKGKKPSITAKLGVTGVPKLEEMLLPPTGDEDVKGVDKKTAKQKGDNARSSRRSTRQPKHRSESGVTETKKKDKNAKSQQPEILVQMSHEWIVKNISKSLSGHPTIAIEILEQGKKIYSCHLIYAPRHLASARQHAEAYEQGSYTKASTHTNHDVPPEYRHNDHDIKVAVNTKKANLRKKHGNLKTLEAEK